MATEVLSCPFCSFTDTDDYILTLHVEELHTEDSPFVVKDSPYLAPPSSTREHLGSGTSVPSSCQHEPLEEYCLCPEEECGEEVLLTELNEHLDLHMAERLTLDAPTSRTRSVQDVSSTENAFFEQDFSTNLPGALRRRESTQKSSSNSGKSSLRRSILSLGLDTILPSTGKSAPSKHRKVGGRLGVSARGRSTVTSHPR